MPTIEQCHRCTKYCPQMEGAKDVAKSRYWYSRLYIDLEKRIESGQLVEVVRCKDCDYCYPIHNKDGSVYVYHCEYFTSDVDGNDFCSNGEPRVI